MNTPDKPNSNNTPKIIRMFINQKGILCDETKKLNETQYQTYLWQSQLKPNIGKNIKSSKRK